MLIQFLAGHQIPQLADDDFSDIAEVIGQQLDQLQSKDADETRLLQAARDMDLLDLDVHYQEPLYTAVLIETAQRFPKLARLIASQVEGDANKPYIDYMAQSIGCFRAAQAIVADFTEHRLLFGRKLADFQLTRTRHLVCMARLCKQETLLISAQREQDKDFQFLMQTFARTSKQLIDEQLQMMGATGYMRESGLPNIFETLQELTTHYRPPLTLTGNQLLKSLPTESQPLAVTRQQETCEELNRRLHLDLTHASSNAGRLSQRDLLGEVLIDQSYDYVCAIRLLQRDESQDSRYHLNREQSDALAAHFIQQLVSPNHKVEAVSHV